MLLGTKSTAKRPRKPKRRSNVMFIIHTHPKLASEDIPAIGDKETRDKIRKKALELLRVDPIGVGKKLHTPLGDCYTLKIFNMYRIVYQVFPNDNLVFVVVVGKRRDSEVYDEAKKRLNRSSMLAAMSQFLFGVSE